MAPEGRQFVIVTGAPRSGCAALANMLGAHPEALLIDEPGQIPRLLTALCSGDPARAEAALQAGLHITARKYFDREARLGPKGAPLPDHISCVVLRTPAAAWIAGRLTHPRARVIWVTRDPRDMAASVEKVAHLPVLDEAAADHLRYSSAALTLPDAPPAERAAALWAKAEAAPAQFGAAGTPLMRLSYEQSVTAPEAAAEQMQRFAGLPPHPAVTAHPAVLFGQAPGFGMRIRPVDTMAIGSWRRRLSAETAETILKTARPAPGALHEAPPPALAPQVSEAALDAPVIAFGRGGSGTRLSSAVLDSFGLFLGNQLNPSNDSIEWVDLIYEMALKVTGRASSDLALWRTELRARARAILDRAPEGSADLWGWKLPESSLVVPELAASFPRARWLYLLRHPVDTCMRRSHVTSRINHPVGRATLEAAYALAGRGRVPEDAPQHILNAMSWWYQVRLFRRAMEDLPPERVHILRFEAICADPEHVLDEVARFLGAPRKVGAAPIEIDPARSWSFDPSDPGCEEVWQICREEAEAFGYAWPLPHPKHAESPG